MTCLSLANLSLAALVFLGNGLAAIGLTGGCASRDGRLIHEKIDVKGVSGS